MKSRLFLLGLVLASAVECYPQTESYSQGQVMMNLAGTHLFQSAWEPYQNQTGLGLSYLRNMTDSKLAMDAGFSMSFARNPCENCTASGTDKQTFDADIFSLNFGVGKWWRSEKASTFLTGGVFGALSDYNTYTPVSGTTTYLVESSSRGHSGLYVRSGLDFKMNQTGLRLGPFLESRISSGSNQKGVSLDVTSIVAGFYFGWRQASRL